MGLSTRRYLLLALALAVVVTAALAWPARAWQGDEGLLSLGLAGLICLVGAAAGRAVAALMLSTGGPADQAPQATQAAVGARLILTLALSLPVFVLQPVAMKPFALWLGAHYLAQMVLEVFVSLRELGQNHGPIGSPARPSQPEAALPSGNHAADHAADHVENDEGAATT